MPDVRRKRSACARDGRWRVNPVEQEMEFLTEFPISAGDEVIIQKTPKNFVFRGTRLLVHNGGKQFTLLAVVVGVNTQTERDIELPLASGLVDLQMEAAAPGVFITLRLRNDGGRPAVFSGELQGLAIPC